MAQNEFAPVKPGVMLKEEFLAEYGLSQNQLAKAIGISPNRIAEIVNNRRLHSRDQQRGRFSRHSRPVYRKFGGITSKRLLWT